MRFASSVVVVAGGTGALGSAVCRAFAQEGGIVYATYRSRAEASLFQEAVGQTGLQIETVQTDVTDEAQVRQLVEALVAKHARINVMVNTVGGYSGGTKLWEVLPEVLDRMLTLNVRSIYQLTRAIVPAMLKEGTGCLVNVSAKAALEHPAGAAAYAASKAAALTLMQSLAAELMGTGIRVNSVLPSTINTEANRRAMPKADFTKWTLPEDIAQVILYLCTKEAKSVHGAAIVV
jgi:NAD(P)-dependent dehydrogenase (short-subunit alcohol dehydrogenase family)